LQSQTVWPPRLYASIPPIYTGSAIQPPKGVGFPDPLSGTLKFVGESEIRERCKSMYLQISKQLREFVRYSLIDRRTDVLLTYLDGHGKS
jgi:hypothetical protein